MFNKFILKMNLISDRSAQLLSITLSVRKVRTSIPGPVKLDTIPPTARYRCDVSSELCSQVISRGDELRHSLHISV